MCNKSAVNNTVALLWEPVRKEERREENMGSCSAKTKKNESAVVSSRGAL